MSPRQSAARARLRASWRISKRRMRRGMGDRRRRCGFVGGRGPPSRPPREEDYGNRLDRRRPHETPDGGSPFEGEASTEGLEPHPLESRTAGGAGRRTRRPYRSVAQRRCRHDHAGDGQGSGGSLFWWGRVGRRRGEPRSSDHRGLLDDRLRRIERNPLEACHTRRRLSRSASGRQSEVRPRRQAFERPLGAESGLRQGQAADHGLRVARRRLRRRGGSWRGSAKSHTTFSSPSSART